MNTLYLFLSRHSLLIPYSKTKIILGPEKNHDLILEGANRFIFVEFSTVDNSWILQEPDKDLKLPIESGHKFWIGEEEVLFFASWDDYNKYQEITVKTSLPKEQIATETLRIIPPTSTDSSFRQKIPNFLILCLVVINSYIILLPNQKILPQTNWSETALLSFDKIDKEQSKTKSKLLWREIDSWPIFLLNKNELAEKQEQMIKCFEEKKYSEALQIYEKNIYPEVYRRAKSLENIAQYNRWLFHFLDLYHQTDKTDTKLKQELETLESQVKTYLKSVNSQEPFFKLIKRIHKLGKDRRKS